MRIELINTGTELMLGFNLNSHLAFLGQTLAAQGLRLARQVTVADDRAEMRAALAESLTRADVLLITGGLGPTSDDFTRDVVAELLGRNLVRDETVVAAISERYRQRNLQMPASVFVQAMVPVGATVLPNANGTAPGLTLEHERKLLILLPGPPRELQPMFANQVLPLLLARRGPAPDFACRVLKTVGLPESQVEAQVAPALADMPAVEIGYCARPGEVEIRLIANFSAVQQAEQRVLAALSANIIGDADARLEELVVRLLTDAQKTVATAESCTGGLIANRLTNVSGSSNVFRCGWVTYSNEAKMRDLGVREETLKQFGAVSEQTAREMAVGARQRSGADYALSATGIAGPTGGTPDKPVGLVFIGLATPTAIQVQRHHLAFDRETFKSFVSQTALNMLRLELTKSH